MRLLVITNLYPPQELGGYGRSMADFVWGLQQRGHHVEVITSDAAYLGGGGTNGPQGERVHRELQLKGTYQGGVQRLEDPAARAAMDATNAEVIRRLAASTPWDGVLLGNLDLLGPELIAPVLSLNVPIQHHVGFVAPPYPAALLPPSSLYQPVPASEAVRSALGQAGWPVQQAAVVYPGARCELFGPEATGLSRPLPADGSPSRPLKVCFAGLMMASKGAHTLVEALIQLHRDGLAVQATLAGAAFQVGYREQLEGLVRAAGLDQAVRWVGQLQRPALARLYALHHVGVFPSIHPEAFGIVGAEMMASGLVLVTSGVGGAAELVEPGVSGLRFEPGQAQSLADALRQLMAAPALQQRLAAAGRQRVQQQFSVETAARQLEHGFRPWLAVF
jgi:glycogen(starch) synthase